MSALGSGFSIMSALSVVSTTMSALGVVSTIMSALGVVPTIMSVLGAVSIIMSQQLGYNVRNGCGFIPTRLFRVSSHGFLCGSQTRSLEQNQNVFSGLFFLIYPKCLTRISA